MEGEKDRLARAVYNKMNARECQAAVDRMAQAYRSDPFMAARVKMHLETGLALPSDYQAEFMNEPRVISTNGMDVRVITKVPINIKVLSS